MASISFARRAALVCFALFAIAGSAFADDDDQFVASWAVGHINPLPTGTLQFNNQTLREVVHTSIGGDEVRVRISNVFGSQTLVIGEAHIAMSAGGSKIVPGTDRVLTFSGQPSVNVYAGSPALSDPVRLDVKAISDLAVSIYLPNATAGETSTFIQGTSFVSAGNQTAAPELSSPSAVGAWPFVSGVNVSAEKKAASIVAFADSATITSAWPRALAERLQASPSTDHLAVVSLAIAGNRMLHNSASPVGPASPNNQWGQSLLTRYDRDVLGQAGVGHLIVFIGLNDIAGPGGFFPLSEEVTVDDLIAGYRQLIARAHEKGLTIQACTLPPLEGNTSLPGFDTPAHEAKRQAFNAWIRSSGEFDAVIDVDRILRDPSHPTRLLPAYDSGDHLHPNTAGGRAIAVAIDLRVFR